MFKLKIIFLRPMPPPPPQHIHTHQCWQLTVITSVGCILVCECAPLGVVRARTNAGKGKKFEMLHLYRDLMIDVVNFSTIDNWNQLATIMVMSCHSHLRGLITCNSHSTVPDTGTGINKPKKGPNALLSGA
jgi:hypothetical protein